LSLPVPLPSGSSLPDNVWRTLWEMERTSSPVVNDAVVGTAAQITGLLTAAGRLALRLAERAHPTGGHRLRHLASSVATTTHWVRDLALTAEPGESQRLAALAATRSLESAAVPEAEAIGAVSADDLARLKHQLGLASEALVHLRSLVAGEALATTAA